MSEFWERKLRTYFQRLDCNNDGFLTKEDFEIVADRSSEDLDLDSPRRKIIKDLVVGFFRRFEDAGVDGKVTMEQYIGAFQKLREDPGFAVYIREAGKGYFDVLDRNGDGLIQEEEYIRFFYNIRVPEFENFAKIAFKAMDHDKDGVLSREEFGEALFDFFVSEDQIRPGTLLFGPLI